MGVVAPGKIAGWPRVVGPRDTMVPMLQEQDWSLRVTGRWEGQWVGGAVGGGASGGKGSGRGSLGMGSTGLDIPRKKAGVAAWRGIEPLSFVPLRPTCQQTWCF